MANTQETAIVTGASQGIGAGLVEAFLTFLAAQILAAGKTPFLHVKSENGAKVVYQQIGFRLRAAIWLTVISLR
jgi:predicted GNAT family acetyltransferase